MSAPLREEAIGEAMQAMGLLTDIVVCPACGGHGETVAPYGVACDFMCNDGCDGHEPDICWLCDGDGKCTKEAAYAAIVEHGTNYFLEVHDATTLKCPDCEGSWPSILGYACPECGERKCG